VIHGQAAFFPIPENCPGGIWEAADPGDLSPISEWPIIPALNYLFYYFYEKTSIL